MKKMELSGTIPLTELPAENKVLNGHTGGSVPVDVDAFIDHQAADGPSTQYNLASTKLYSHVPTSSTSFPNGKCTA